MQATLASFITAFYVVNAHGGVPVGPQPGPQRPTPVGPSPGRPVGPQPGTPFGCPQSPIAPEVGSYCSQPGLECNYASLGEFYQCGRDWTWLAKPPNPTWSCYKDGHTYKNGYEFINAQGCVEWECQHGVVHTNSCPAPPHGCFKNGKTYPNHYQPPPDAAGCVEWQCENGKIRYNPCPAHPDHGCWRHGFYYTDGYTSYSTDGRHCPVWKCMDGHIEYLGACPDRRGCYKNGMKYSDGFTKYINGCAVWTCSDGDVRYLGGCPPAHSECELNGHKVPVGTRVQNYHGSGFNCARAQCFKGDDGQAAKFQCILG